MQEKQMFSNKSILTLLWPLLVEQLLSVMVGMVDVLMVSTLGDEAVSGVALVDSINNLVIMVFTSLCAGGTVVCAQFIGAGNNERTRRMAGQLVLIALSAAIFVTGCLQIGGNGLLSVLFGKVEPGVMTNSLVYMRFTSLSFPFLALYTSGFSLFRAVGNSRVSMMVSLCMNLLNVIGNAFCIFVLGMGVTGVAIPTLLSRVFAAVVIVVLLKTKDKRICISGLSDLRPDGGIIKNILSIGIPNSVETGLFQFGKVTLQSLVSTLGTASIAGFAIASNLVTYMYLPGNALGVCMLTIVGQCVGAEEYRQAKQNANKLMVINYIMVTAVCILCVIFNSKLVGLYSLEPDAALIAENLFFIHAIAMVLWPPAFLLPYYFRANHHAKFTMVISISSMWIFRILGAYFFVRVLNCGVQGVWYAMFVDWVARTIIYGGRFALQGRALKKETQQ